MNSRRELSLGLLAGLVSLVIIGGSFITSLAEGKLSVAQIPQVITSSPFPTSVIFTPRPGEPTLIPSPIPPPSETEESSNTSSACPMPPGWMEITVNPGDTLESLAVIYNVSVEDLSKKNCLLIDSLIPGTILRVPTLTASPSPTRRPSATACRPPWGWVLYTIKSGDTLFSLAKAFGITLDKLMAENCLVSSDIIAGDKIWVPNVPTITPPPSFTPTITPSFTPSFTLRPPTITNTTTPTSTSTSTASPTISPIIPSSTSTNTPTHTSTSTPLPTATPVPTEAPTSAPSVVPNP